MQTTLQNGRRRGHPRATGEVSQDPRIDIIKASVQLFKQNGYAKTSMTAIARAAGLDQSSLYYWFGSKEHLLDEILVHSFTQCCFRGKLFHAAAPRSVRLYALLYRRTYKCCMLPVDVFEVEAAADKDPKRFERFFSEFEDYKLNLYTLISEGINAGEFIDYDPKQATTLMISIIMSQQHQYHRKETGKAAFVVAEQGQLPSDDVSAWANLGAQLGVSALLADLSSLDGIRKEAEDRGWLQDA